MKSKLILLTPLFLMMLGSAFAETLGNPTAQAKVDAKISEIRQLAADPMIVAAILEHNAHLPAAHAAMTQETWKTLAVVDPFVRAFMKNEAAVRLREAKAEWLTEAFLSDAAGQKVAFLSKTTNWSHAGKPKHDEPMAGRVWQGKVELDESTGMKQLQVSVPVLSNGKPVGSLVVGISLSALLSTAE